MKNETTTPAASASRHTPEPWKCSCEGVDPHWSIITAKGGLIVANVHNYGKPEANSVRICACVNACAGMADPSVEISALRSRSNNVPAMCAEVETLRAEIAALREALKGCRELLANSEVQFKICNGGAGNLGEHSLYHRTMNAARAALKGGAQ